MSQVLGYISLNTENIPINIDTTQYIRVRIPEFHGSPEVNSNTDNKVTPDNALPWAKVLKPITADLTFIATDFFSEGEIVAIEIHNGDLTDLTVLGKFSNYLYTDDPDEINSREAAIGHFNGLVDYTTNTSLSIASSIVKTALSQVTTPPITDGGCNKVKYNAWYYTGKETATTYTQDDWCCAFVCWVFNKSGCKEYFYGGNKTALCNTLYNYHKSIGEQVAKETYKAGDLLFMNFKNGSNITHVEIAVSDWDPATKTIDCVGGNVYIDSTQNGVAKNTRTASQILYGIRPGTAVYSNRTDPGWKQSDPRWKNNIMTSKTIGQVGCLITSISILLRMTGLTKASFTPAVLNDYLRRNNGYSGNSLKWAKTDNYVDGWKWSGEKTLSGSKTSKYNKIRELLDAGNYVVIAVKNRGHWVAATGYTSTDIIISDPGYKKTRLSEWPDSGVTACHIFTCKNPFKLS